MSERRRSFFGWGYEEDAVSADELGRFERAWSQLFHVDRFDPAPFPRESRDHLAQAPAVGACQFEGLLYRR